MSSFAQFDEVVSLNASLDSMRPLLKPPVANAMLFDGQFKVMVVGGPNQRKDFHIEMGAEIFYQREGPMEVIVLHPQTGKSHVVRIEEGEFFYLPPGVPHSPQRFENTLGIVYERVRDPSESDALCWYNPDDSVLYAEYFYCSSLGTQVKEAIERYNAFLADPHPLPPIPSSADGLLKCIEAARDIPLPKPFNLAQAIEHLPMNALSRLPLMYYGHHAHDNNILTNTHENITEFVVQVSKGNHTGEVIVPVSVKEVYLWQWKGSSTITIEDDESVFTLMKEGDVLLLKETTAGVPITRLRVHTEHASDVLLINTNHDQL